jgi:hypothetical protein
MILIQPIHNLKQKNTKTIFLVCELKMHFKKLCRFSGTFSAMAITAATDNFFGKLCSYSKRAVHLPPELQVPCGGLGNFFFNGLEVQKPAGLLFPITTEGGQWK